MSSVCVCMAQQAVLQQLEISIFIKFSIKILINQTIRPYFLTLSGAEHKVCALVIQLNWRDAVSSWADATIQGISIKHFICTLIG